MSGCFRNMDYILITIFLIVSNNHLSGKVSRFEGLAWKKMRRYCELLMAWRQYQEGFIQCVGLPEIVAFTPSCKHIGHLTKYTLTCEVHLLLIPSNLKRLALFPYYAISHLVGMKSVLVSGDQITIGSLQFEKDWWRGFVNYRFHGEKTVDGSVEWVATSFLKLPRILYYGAKGLVTHNTHYLSNNFVVEVLQGCMCCLCLKFVATHFIFVWSFD
jgi:hypothetical protein